MDKAVVLLSGGLDSSVNLYEAYKNYNIVKVLTFNYGQKAYRQELKSSQLLCKDLKLNHQIIDLDWLCAISSSSLTDQNQEVPNTKQIDIHSVESSLETAKSVWVPNRNGLFLNIAASIAEGLKAQVVIPGFNLEEAQSFPDNSKAFLQACNEVFKISTQNSIEVKCYTIDSNKPEILKRSQQIKLPLSYIWPCYQDKEMWCVDCESCLRFKHACEIEGLNFEELRQQRKTLNAD